jgi:hypothetical protein
MTNQAVKPLNEEMNPGPPKYKDGMLTITPREWVPVKDQELPSPKIMLTRTYTAVTIPDIPNFPVSVHIQLFPDIQLL